MICSEQSKTLLMNAFATNFERTEGISYLKDRGWTSVSKDGYVDLFQDPVSDQQLYWRKAVALAKERDAGPAVTTSAIED